MLELHQAVFYTGLKSCTLAAEPIIASAQYGRDVAQRDYWPDQLGNSVERLVDKFSRSFVETFEILATSEFRAALLESLRPQGQKVLNISLSGLDSRFRDSRSVRSAADYP